MFGRIIKAYVAINEKRFKLYKYVSETRAPPIHGFRVAKCFGQDVCSKWTDRRPHRARGAHGAHGPIHPWAHGPPWAHEPSPTFILRRGGVGQKITTPFISGQNK